MTDRARSTPAPSGRPWDRVLTIVLNAANVIGWLAVSAFLFFVFPLVGTGCNGLGTCGASRGMSGIELGIAVAAVVVVLGCVAGGLVLARRGMAIWIPIVAIVLSTIALFVGAGEYLTNYAS